MWYKIRLNDGTELDVRWCGVADGVMSINLISELSFLSVAQLFTDPQLTATITFLYGNTQRVFEGYTKIAALNASVPGEYIVSMKQG